MRAAHGGAAPAPVADSARDCYIFCVSNQARGLNMLAARHDGLLSEFVRAVFSIGQVYSMALPVDPARKQAADLRETVRRQR